MTPISHRFVHSLIPYLSHQRVFGSARRGAEQRPAALLHHADLQRGSSCEEGGAWVFEGGSLLAKKGKAKRGSRNIFFFGVAELFVF